MADSTITPGYRTTEFWLTIAVNAAAILQTLAGVLDPKWAALLMTVANGIYAISRGQVKAASLK